MALCTIVGCDRPPSARGLCPAHSTRLKRHGDVMADVPVEPRARRRPAQPERECTRCHHTKPIEDFPKSKRYRGGHERQCKECARDRHRRYYRLRNGWTDELAEQRMREQDGHCPICAAEIDNRTSRADHNHATGEPRGLLCDACNKGLGHFADDPERIARAIAYLNHYSGV